MRGRVRQKESRVNNFAVTICHSFVVHMKNGAHNIFGTIEPLLLYGNRLFTHHTLKYFRVCVCIIKNESV